MHGHGTGAVANEGSEGRDVPRPKRAPEPTLARGRCGVVRRAWLLCVSVAWLDRCRLFRPAGGCRSSDPPLPPTTTAWMAKHHTMTPNSQRFSMSFVPSMVPSFVHTFSPPRRRFLKRGKPRQRSRGRHGMTAIWQATGTTITCPQQIDGDDMSCLDQTVVPTVSRLALAVLLSRVRPKARIRQGSESPTGSRSGITSPCNRVERASVDVSNNPYCNRRPGADAMPPPNVFRRARSVFRRARSVLCRAPRLATPHAHAQAPKQ